MFGFLKKLFSSTITVTESGKNYLISLSSAKPSIKIGTSLVVPENYTAYIVAKHKVLDNFSAGSYKLTGATMPLAAKVLKLNKVNKNGSLPNKFKADIYFIKLENFEGVEFTNPDKVVIKDKRFLKAKVGFKGYFSFKINNHEDLLTILIKDIGLIRGDMALKRLSFWVAYYAGIKIRKNKPGLEELFNRESECFEGLGDFIAKKLADAGIQITSIEITDILLPKKVYKKTDLSFLEVDTRVKPVENQLENASLNEKLEKDAINNKIMLENNMVEVNTALLENKRTIEYKKCEKCASVNPAQAKFCFNCANPFKKTCQNCGATLNENDFVCSNCKSIVV